MKTLSRDAIQRMTDGGVGGTFIGGGESSAGYASMSWVEANFVSKEFFSRIFKINGQTVNNETPVVLPNDMQSTISNIEALFTFFSDGGVSALGLSSGGGGGGATTLGELSDVVITDPQNGQALIYNSGTGMWVNGAGGGGGVTLNEPLSSINTAGLGTPTATGQVITWNGSQWIYSIPGGGGGGGTGTVTSITAGTGLSGGTITTMGTIALSTETQTNIGYGVTAYGWGNHADAGYLKSITSSAVTTALGYTPLSNSTSFWGQTVSSGVVNGSIEAGNSGGAISGFHSIELNSHGTLSGYGGFIDFHFNGSSSDYTSRIIEDASGRLFLDASVGVRIGSAILSWDSVNNALKIQKIDGTAANFYATGGVSALGVMATDSGMLENLNLTGRLKFIDMENEYEQQIYGDTDGYLHINASEGIELNSDLNLNGYTLYMTGGNIDANYVSGKRFYLGTTRYLYLDANNLLKYYDNGTIRTIAFA